MKSKPGVQFGHRPYAKVSRLPARIRNRVNQMLYDVRRHDKADRQRTQPPKDSVTDENLERICDRFNLK